VKFCLTIVVWGDWHLDQLEAHGLPSLRAPGNLDAIDYRISAWTRPADLPRLMKLLNGMPAFISILLPNDVKGDQATANAAVYACNCRDQAEAAERGEAWMQIAPDMVWGWGTLDHHRRALESGKNVVFRPLLRVDASKTGTIKNFDKEHLAKVALDCEHSMATTYYRADGKHFSPHAEMVIWDAPGGLLNQTITAEVQTCVPSRVRLSPDRILATAWLDEIEVVTDSDDVITLAMCPPDKEFLFRGNKPLTPETVRAFLRTYPSEVSRLLMQRPYWLHADYLDRSPWVWTEIRALDFANKVFEND
jgi:hypothetical protein